LLDRPVVKLALALPIVFAVAACGVEPAPEESAGIVPTASPSARAIPAPVTSPDAPPTARPDAPPPSADAAPRPTPEPAPVTAFVPEIGQVRARPPDPTSCGGGDQAPMLPQAKPGKAPAGEAHGGLDKSFLLETADRLTLGTRALTTVAPLCVDADGDGWYDGPCNERYKLYLTQIKCNEEQDFWGGDEFYLIADDARHPQGDLDDTWDLNEGDVIQLDHLVASRTRGVDMPQLAVVHIEGWEDDFEIFNIWTADDLLFSDDVDLGAMKDGDTFTRHYVGPDGDYDYELSFRVAVEKFTDPTPGADGDADHDGIPESREARVARDFGGIVDPERPDVNVEVDWMPGHGLNTNTKREVVTQYARHGLHLNIIRDREIALDDCLTIPEARALYANEFTTKGYGAFRYAVLGEKFWLDRSGVAWGDMFIVDDDTWWIDNWILPQAGTFIHELGHTMGLNQQMFHIIDTIGWPSYESAMNYLYQAIKVDYSDEGAGGDTNDHNDWAVVDPAYGLQWSFGLVTDNDVGVCK
jgi:hypothetical protein